jgi:aryl sulfotransferase
LTAVRYQNFLSDNARWDGLRLRPGDIIISAPPKCGTTWTQMICALLIFQTPVPPRPLDLISPWLEMRLRRKKEVVDLYEAQPHRRFIKSHTPLDGLPAGDGVTYVSMGRDPRDVGLSMHAHLGNLDMRAALTALAEAIEPGDSFEPPPRLPAFASEQEAFLHWVDDPTPPQAAAMSLAGTVHHLAGFWAARRRGDVVLLYYDDLQADLEGEMRRLADRLGIEVPEARWPALVDAATFAEMRRRADVVAPDTAHHLWKSNTGFFHRGRSGQWRDVLDDGGLARYEARVRALAPPDLIGWLHHGTL